MAGSKDLTTGLRLILEHFAALEPAYRNVGLLQETTGRGLDELAGLARKVAEEGWDKDTAAAKDYAAAMVKASPEELKVAEEANKLKLELGRLATEGFIALGPDIENAIGFLKTFVGWIKQGSDGIAGFIGNVRQMNVLGLKLHDYLFGTHTAEITLPEVVVKPPPGTTPAGTEKPGKAKGGGGAKGQESEIEAWQEALTKQLIAEKEFFKDSTAEELAFWQSKVGLTKAGSKERFEVEQKIFGLEKSLAHQTEAEKEGELDAEKRVSDAKYQRAVQLVQSEERLGKISAADALAQETTLLNQKWAADQAYYAKKTAAAQGDSKTIQKIANDEKVAYQANLTEKQRLTEATALQIQNTWKTALTPIEDAFSTFAEDAIFHTKSIAQAFDDMMKSILSSMLKSAMQGLFNSLLFGGGAAGAGGVGTGGAGAVGSSIGGAIGGSSGILGSLLGLGSAAGSVASGASAIGGLFATGGGLDTLTGAFASASAAGASAGGGLGAVLPFLGTLFSFFERGGIASARGGWTVPSFASGGVLSMLHSNEMVLPAHISQFVQDAAARGGGGGHTFNLNISAMDGASVMRAGPALVASINRAMRNGSVGYANG